MELAIVIAVVVVALVFDYTNGFHDAANAIATSVSTRALTPRIALAMAAVMNFVGAFLGQEVADTVGSEDGGYARADSQDAFERLLSRLDQRERTLLSLRFEHDLRQAEIGRRTGYSQMHVSRLIKAALERLAGAPELRAAV